jgi:DNA-binding NarL/FixJ family response regulator
LIGRLGANTKVGHWLENYFPLCGGRDRVIQVGVLVIPLPGLWIQPDSNRESSGLTALLKELSSKPRGAINATNQSKASQNQQPPASKLSVRETDVLRLLAQGASRKEVAATLAISVRTVETYRERMIRKLNVSTLGQLVQHAIRHHIIGL